MSLIFGRNKSTKKARKLKAFGLLEMVIVIGLLGVLITTLYSFGTLSVEFSSRRRVRNELVLAINETINAAIVNRNSLWSDIFNATNTGTKHFEFASNSYTVQDGTEEIGSATVGFTVNPVFRDGDGNISEMDLVTEDINVRKLDILATGEDRFGGQITVSTDVYISNWNTPIWTQNTEIDFNSGIFNNLSYDPDTGAIIFDNNATFSGDWCEINPYVRRFDLPGNGVYRSINRDGDDNQITFLSESTDRTLLNVEFDPYDTSSLSTISEGTGYIAYHGAENGSDTVIVGSTDDDKEIVVFDTSTNPATEVGSTDLPGEEDAIMVKKVSGDLFAITGDTFYSVNVAGDYSGTGTVLDSFELGGDAVWMRTMTISDNNYAYVAIHGDAKDIQFLDIEDPSNISEVAYIDLPASANLVKTAAPANELDYVVVGTYYSDTDPEVYIYDVSTVSGELSEVSNIDVDMTVNKITTNSTPDDRIIAVGEGGENNIYVIDIDTPGSPSVCNSMSLGGDDTLYFSQIGTNDAGDNFLYVVSDNKDGEFIVYQGGSAVFGLDPGGQFYTLGDYQSAILDTTYVNPDYLSLTWQEITTINTDIHFQVRAAASAGALSSEPWIGPDGTNSTFFEDPPDGANLPSSIDGKRYFQFRAYFFSTDTINTPYLTSVILNYEDGG